jgi:hypothetical protein
MNLNVGMPNTSVKTYAYRSSSLLALSVQSQSNKRNIMSDKPKFRLADEEDIAGMSTAFTLPGRLAKQLADRQKRIEQRQEQDPVKSPDENHE